MPQETKNTGHEGVDGPKNHPMKKVIALILVAFVTGAIAYGSDFCRGFKQGYKEGYCYQRVHCLEPLPPLCPLPGFGEKTWMDGYNRGFIIGMNKRR